MRDLAKRLLAANHAASDPHVHEAVLVSEKLRVPLTRFAGTDGFASLLRRALALARAEVPTLQDARVSADGRLEGLEAPASTAGAGAGGSEAAVALTAQLLGLLVTFIGQPFTLRMVREAWPDAALDESQSRIETLHD